MNPLRPVIVHTVLLVAGALAASLAWSKEKTPLTAQETNVTVWGGRPTDVQRIAYDSPGKKIVLEAQQEKKGERWFLGTAERPNLQGPSGDVNSAPKMSIVFASVTQANKLAESFAPLKAVRSLGKVPQSREAEFGFEKRESTVTLTIAGKERKLVIGATAPGGSDSYVIDPATNEAYVVKADVLRDLESGDATRLMEREQHDFKDVELTSARIIAGGKTRKLVRGGQEGKKFWADPGDKDKADETAGNWLQKIEHLRVSEYAAKPPEGRAEVVRIEYEAGSGNIGFFELAKTPATTEGQKADYWILTEHTHLYGKVFPGSAEQVEQDVASVVK